MKEGIRMAGAAAVLVLLAGSTWAGVGVTLKAGTLGLGADVTFPLVASNLNFRAGYNGAALNLDVDLDEAACDGKITWSTIPILLDWHPGGGDFRLSGGVVINNNKVVLSATPTQAFELNDVEYSIEGVDGDITFEQVAWYIGIGGGNALAEGRVHVAIDFGVMFQGKPTAAATATASIPALQDAINADLQTEVDEFQKDYLDSFVIYPVISMGISFTFF